MNSNSDTTAAEQIDDQDSAVGEPVAEPGAMEAAERGHWKRRAEREQEQPPVKDQAEPVKPRLLDRLAADLIAALSEWKCLSERPRSWREHLAYARIGEWTVQGRGLRRDLMQLYDWAIAIPVATVATLLLVVVDNPGRFFSLSTICVITATFLNTIPVVKLLVPDVMTVTYWLSWIF